MIKFENLYSYQKEAIDFIAKHRGRALVSVCPGGGKTLICIHLILKYQALIPTLVVCPASIKLQWEAVIREYFPRKQVTVLGGTPSDDKVYNVQHSDFVIINYDILDKWADVFSKIKFTFMIADESHKCKTPGTKRTEALFKIAETIKYRVLLTGTPMTNGVSDLWSQLYVINPTIFPHYKAFLARFAPPKPIIIKGELFNKKIVIPGNPRNLSELNNVIRNNFFKVPDKEVYQNIPEMQNIVIPIASSNIALYKEAERRFKQSKLTTNEEFFKAQANLANLRKILGETKVNSAVDWLSEFQEIRNNKVVVFAYHRNVVEKLVETLGASKCVTYYGGMSDKAKEEAKTKFIKDQTIKFFVCNSTAASTGIDGLQEATNTAVFVEMLYSYAEFSQAKARVRRKNSEFDHYFCYNLCVPDTMDERIIQIMDAKAKESVKILEGKDISQRELLSALLNK